MRGFDSLGQHYVEQQNRRPGRTSPCSSSDDGTSAKMDEMLEDTELTSGALTSDGTPRRPLNAFLIFARRRRPQVSAENQGMRTGDISKVLNEEWNSMDMADKGFYLDQAKRLKETFDSKYPDYVYRRRLYSYRKARPAAVAGPLSDPLTSDSVGNDFAVAHDFDYLSIDAQDLARDLARDSSHPGVASGHDDNSNVTFPHPALKSCGCSGDDFPQVQLPSLGPRLPDLSSFHDHPRLETTSLVSQPLTTNHHRAIQPAWASAPLVLPLNVGNQLCEGPNSPAHVKSEVYFSSQASPAESKRHLTPV